MPTAAIYSRISQKADDETTSLDTQERSCRSLARKLRLTVDERFVFKEDWPGDTLDRPLLTQLRSHLKERHFDVLLVHATDRLARNPIHLAIIAEQCDKARVELHFVTEPLDSSPEGQLILYIKGYAAQIEREKIKERTLRGRKERALKGKLPVGGSGLYGYDYIKGREKGQGVRVINEDQAATIRLMFRWLIEEDLSIWAIANRLQNQGIPAPKGGSTWGVSSVSRALNQEMYTGKTFANRFKSVAPKSHRTPNLRHPNNALELRPKEDWIELPDTTPPIIDDETFAKAQEALKHHTMTSPRNVIHPYLLRGHIKCGICNRQMYGTPGRTKHYYVCSSKRLVGLPKTCQNQMPQAERLDEQIWEAVKEALLQPEVLEGEINRRIAEQSDDTGDLAAIDSRLRKIKDRETRLIKLYSYEEIDEETLHSQVKLLKKEKEGLEEERRKIEGYQSERKLLENHKLKVREYCQRAAVNIEDFTFEEKRDALEGLAVVITVTPEKIVLDGILPDDIALPGTTKWERNTTIPFSLTVASPAYVAPPSPRSPNGRFIPIEKV